VDSQSASTRILLKSAFHNVQKTRPFAIDAIAVLPDHSHCLWKLLEDDADFSTRWMLIKKNVSTAMVSEKNHRGEKQIWQRRFWEHLIRDENDYRKHMDYIHSNPVKHGYVGCPAEWQYSSFIKAVTDGWYDPNWGSLEPQTIKNMNCE
jgi:putative transposase